MGVDNIIIPGGILSTWPGLPLDDSDSTREQERFDIIEVARQPARALSVVLDSQSHDRQDTFERLARIVQLNDTTQTALQQGSTPSAPNGTTPQRSTTINLGGLGRTRITGRSTPANPGLRLDRRASNYFPTGTKVAQKPFSEDTTRKLENSYVFQSLGNYQLAGQRSTSDSTLAPVFLARNNSDTKTASRRESSLPKVERNQSITSQLTTIDVVRRVSVVVGNVVETVKETVASALRRSSLQETYEKAKLRQIQLMRSPFVQYAFEYFFYLLMAAFVYFVFVGYPLWTGLVLTIYYLFDMKLVVPAGTAIFLGIGFL